MCASWPVRGHWRRPAGVDDRARDAPGIALLAVPVDHVRQVLFRHLGQQARGRRSLAAVHPHVQRLVPAEAEAPALDVELHRRHPEIGNGTVHARVSAGIEHTPDIAVVGVHELETIAERLQPRASLRQRLAVPVEAEHPGRTCLEERTRVPTEPDRAVHDRGPRGRAPAGPPPR
jgi:hypothetical protein